MSVVINVGDDKINVEIPDGFPMGHLNQIMQQIVKSASNHEGTLSSVKISIEDGEISWCSSFNMDDNDGRKPSFDGDDPEPSFIDDSYRQGNGTLSHGLSAEVTTAKFDMYCTTNANGQCEEMPEDCDFINDGATDDDIQQGGLGDCWFLSALASLAVDLPDKYDSTTRRAAAQRVIQKEHNNAAIKAGGDFLFKFFRMGEWHDITIDRLLPTSRRARPSKTNEWWVPLTEKAYAKLNGSYDNIDGGVTAWALTELTGGVAAKMELTWEKVNDIGVEELKAFVRKYLAKNGLFCTSNEADGIDEDYEANGLIKGHCYSLLSFEEVDTSKGTVSLVRIRNPHGGTEWNGAWSDNSTEWNEVSDEVKASINYADEDDGGFFMSFEDWVNEFEDFTMCFITDNFNLDQETNNDLDTRAIGTLFPGKNAGKCLEHNLQFTLVVPKDQDIWFQMLQNTTSAKEKTFVMLNLYKREEIPEKRLDLRYVDPTLEYIKPLFPKNGKNCQISYHHNGWCYQLAAGTYFISAAYNVPDKRKYMFRVIGEGISLNLLS